MLKTFEARYENGQLTWVGDGPDAGPYRVLVTVLDESPEQERRPPETVQQVLEDTFGVWSTGDTPDQVDQSVKQMRAKWDRPWYHNSSSDE